MNAIRLVNTKELTHDDWLEWRRKGIGGSDVAAICGMNPYKSPLAVYLDKTDQIPPTEDNPKMKAGRILEPVIADWFKEETGYKVWRQNCIFQHPEYHVMLANIDRWLPGENAGLECKNTSEYNRDDWFDGYEEVIPVSYQLQANHYMAVTGADRWFVAVLIGGWDFQWRVIERDDNIVQKLIQIETSFWSEHVEKHIPPDVSHQDSEYINEKYPESNGQSFDLSESYYDLVKELLDSKKALKQANIRHDDAKNKMKDLMGENELAYWQGEKMFSWKTDKRGRRTFKILGGL